MYNKNIKENAYIDTDALSAQLETLGLFFGVVPDTEIYVYTYMYACVKQSTGHTHTGHTGRKNTPDTGTHTRMTRPPNEHLPQALNNAQRWRDDGACHLPRPGGWPLVIG